MDLEIRFTVPSQGLKECTDLGICAFGTATSSMFFDMVQMPQLHLNSREGTRYV